MAATIKIKNSSTTGAVPTSGDLVQGELAVNVTDLGLYTENSGGTVVKLNAPSIDDKNTGATKYLTISTSGNLGLGAAPKTYLSPSYNAFDMNAGRTALMSSSGTPQTNLLTNGYYDSTDSRFEYSQTGYAASNYVQQSGSHIWYYAASGTAGNAITFTQAMTLDASGNLGVGTSSPSEKLTVNGNINVGTGSTDQAVIFQTKYASITGDAGQNTLTYRTYQTHIWKNATGASSITDGTERMRLDSSGNLLVGTTSLLAGSPRLNVSSTGSYTATFNQTDNTDRVAIRIQNTYAQSAQNATMIQFVDSAGSERGTIKTTGTATSYNTSSDYRLKENIQPMTGALDKVAQLKPVTYTWKSNGFASQGFIAHELQEVVPDCVTGAKDAVDEDGNSKYQGIDTSFLVATLTAAIQELKAIVDAQAVEIAALKA